MADTVPAPFLTPDQLIGRPGDPSLGAGGYTFNPAIQNPLEGIQKSISQANQEVSQQQTQQRQMKNDILLKTMQWEHDDKVQRQLQGLDQQKQFYDMMGATGLTGPNMKDPQGNPMPIDYLPQDQDQIKAQADGLRKNLINPTGTGNPTKIYDPAFRQDFADYQNINKNATARAVYVAQANKLLQQTADQGERTRIQDYIDGINNSKLSSKEMPLPYVAQPTITPTVNYKDWKDEQEEFDNGEGNPNRAYVPFKNTTDAAEIEQGAKTVDQWKKNMSPEQFADVQKSLNELETQRGLPLTTLNAAVIPPSQTNPTAQLQFDESTPSKRLELYRNAKYASELLHSGGVQNPDSSDELKDKLTQADINEKNAQEYKLLHPNDKPKTGPEIKEENDRIAGENAYNEVSEVFNPANFTKDQKINPTGIKGGIFAGLMGSNGLDTKQYDFYKVPSTIDTKRYLGMKKSVTAQKDASGTVTKNATGQPDDFSASYLAVDKKTGKQQLVYVKGDNVKGYKVIAVVPKRAAITNVLKTDANFDEKVYENKVIHGQNIYDQRDGAQSSGVAQPAQAKTPENFTPTINGEKAHVRAGSGGHPEALVNGVWKKVTGRKKNGELITE